MDGDKVCVHMVGDFEIFSARLYLHKASFFLSVFSSMAFVAFCFLTPSIFEQLSIYGDSKTQHQLPSSQERFLDNCF